MSVQSHAWDHVDLTRRSGHAIDTDAAFAEYLAAPGRGAGAVLEATGFHLGRSGRDHLLVYCAACGYPPGRAGGGAGAGRPIQRPGPGEGIAWLRGPQHRARGRPWRYAATKRLVRAEFR
jgi:hypothetical protein